MPGVAGLDGIDGHALAEETPLYAPADIKTVVETALRRAICRTANDAPPRLGIEELREVIGRHQRAIRRDDAVGWIEAARTELGHAEEQLVSLEAEVRQVYGG